MDFKVLTLFPEFFDSFKTHSIIGRAVKEGLLSIDAINIRTFTENKHRQVDDYPYGGGAGMVIQPQPLFKAIQSLDVTPKDRVIYMSPKGTVFNQAMAKELAESERLIFICGHYEGIDQRVIDTFVTDEISIGDYVLTGGEIPAMTVMDSVARMLNGVLGKNVSYEDESHYNGLLEYPHYSRPAVFEGLEVPQVLMSGDHAKIEAWRFEESLRITGERRPDMLKVYDAAHLTKKKRMLVQKYKEVYCLKK